MNLTLERVKATARATLHAAALPARPVILRAERIVRIVQHYRRSPHESVKP
jgi:hypothetical protein